MSSTRKWTPQHYREGCWVESYRRSNGSVVKRHWRAGGSVKGHFTNVNPRDPNSAHSPTPQTPTAPPTRSRPPNVIVHASRNNAALAYVIANSRLGRPVREPNRRSESPTAYITAVSHRDLDGRSFTTGSITAATGSVNLPPICRQITLHVDVHHKNQVAATYRIDAPFFTNSDGSISTVAGQNADPELANHFLERFSAAPPDDLAAIKRRNSTRQLLGRSNPDRSVFLAARDALLAAELPTLAPTREITVEIPDAPYTIVIKPHVP